MSTWVIAAEFGALALGGLLACAAFAVLGVGMSGDSCGGRDALHRCLLCTMVPQYAGLAVLLLGYLGGLGVAIWLPAAGEGPHVGTGWLVVATGIGTTLAILVVCAWIPRHPILRRRARRSAPAPSSRFRAALRGPHG